MTITPNEKYLAVGTKGYYIMIINIEERLKETTFSDHWAYINCLAVSPCGLFIISGSEEAMIRFWRLDSTSNAIVYKKEAFDLLSISISKDGQKLAVGTDNAEVKLYNIKDSKLEFT